jgi:hypothetical protein
MSLALFAGAGGGILAGHMLGWRTVCAVERNAYAASVLAQRQNDGCLPAFPIWSDVCSFDGKQWRGIVDVVSGGFPCQDISAAGSGLGLDGQRSGLWSEMARIIRDVQPNLFTWKTAQCSLLEGLDEFLETWPRWGSMQNGASYLRPIPALPICESASGFWPTCRVFMHKDSHIDRGRSNLGEVVGGPLNPDWTEWLMGWPIGWTDLRPLAMDKFREWQWQHGIFSMPTTMSAANDNLPKPANDNTPSS